MFDLLYQNISKCFPEKLNFFSDDRNNASEFNRFGFIWLSTYSEYPESIRGSHIAEGSGYDAKAFPSKSFVSLVA